MALQDAAQELEREQQDGSAHDNAAKFVIPGRPFLQQVALSLALILRNLVNEFIGTIHSCLDPVYFCSITNSLKYGR